MGKDYGGFAIFRRTASSSTRTRYVSATTGADVALELLRTELPRSLSYMREIYCNQRKQDKTGGLELMNHDVACITYYM